MKMRSLDRCEVFVPMAHLNQHSGVIPYLQECLDRISTDGRTLIKTTLDMGRVIGLCDLVETSEKDQIVHAVRVGRGWPTRFVMNRDRSECNLITVVLKRQGKDKYRMLTAYIGNGAEKELGDPSLTHDERIRSEKFWGSHALVWGSQEVYQNAAAA